MQIGVIGLGRMGANISRRLMRAGHTCVVWDANASAVQGLGKEGAKGVASLKDVVQALQPPRAMWVMLPSGNITETAIAELGGLLSKGDCVIDGGNTYFKDDVRRAKDLTKNGMGVRSQRYAMIVDGDQKTFMTDVIEASRTIPA